MVLSLEKQVLCKAKWCCRDRKEGKSCSWGLREVLKKDSEVLRGVGVCVCV